MRSFVPAQLVLETGAIFNGFAPSWQQETFFGEVVFTTGMTGYPESLTDPSFAGQILTFTYPLIGNYGIPTSETWESPKIHAAGVIVSHATHHWSHHTGLQSFQEWLKEQEVPLLIGIDTRALTKTLRTSGTLLGAITIENKKSFPFIDPNESHLVAGVSIPAKTTYQNGGQKTVVVVVDCGMKANIIRSLSRLPIVIHRVPYNYDYTQEHYDGIFISNGPGNPTKCTETIAILKKAMQNNKPIFGICLGTQLLALAAGAKTYKLPFGHRSQNQPCIETKTKKCYVTSQNHGYAIEENSLPEEWNVSFRNINDGTVEGIEHVSKPFFAVQFHPEASPGPTDTHWLFDKFIQTLENT